MKNKRRYTVIRVCLSLAVMIFAGAPIYWAFVTSFKPAAVNWGGGIGGLWFGGMPTLEHYINILVYNRYWASIIGPNVLRPMLNSTIVALFATSIALTVGSMAAYALALLRMKWKRAVSSYILLAYVFPPFILIVPISIVFQTLGLTDNLVGLMLSHLLISVPFSTWMLRGYFMGISTELVDAAAVDGCSKLGTLLRIIVPISGPGFVTAAIFSFTQSWNEFLYAFVLLENRKHYTMPVAVAALKSTDIIRWGEMMAFCILSAIPPVVLYMVIQKYVVGGLTAGALKG
jgi:multiple sugar transport system permease protein